VDQNPAAIEKQNKKLKAQSKKNDAKKQIRAM
jgi:hypothetical protein